MLLALVSCSGEHEHTPVKVAANAATCTSDGNTEYYRCLGCEKIFYDDGCGIEITLADVTVKSAGHTWTDPTCDEPKTCKVCQATEGESLGHEWSGACDVDCNRQGCDETRTAESHLDADEDDVCDNCGEGISSDIPIGDDDGEFLPPDEFQN